MSSTSLDPARSGPTRQGSSRTAGPDWDFWAARWEDHMTGYLPTRGHALDLLAELVAELVAPDAQVVELGAAVGGLAERLLDRLPDGRLVAMEFDPLLRRIGEERTAALARRLTWCSADLSAPSWHDVLPSRPDAIVTVATLHGIGEEVTRDVYRRSAELLRPGGVLVNLDFAAVAVDRDGDEVAAAVSALATRRNERGAATAFRTHREALAADPVLGPLADERDRLFRVEEHLSQGGGDPPYLDVDSHLRALAACGFRRIEVPWRELDLALMVAVR